MLKSEVEVGVEGYSGEAVVCLSTMVYIRKSYELEKENPQYDSNAKGLTVIMHYGGEFRVLPKAEYIGGDRMVLDFVYVDKFTYADLVEFGGLRVKGELRFHLTVNRGFKLLSDTKELQNWCKKSLKKRKMHVYIEVIEPNPESEHEDEAQNDENDLSDELSEDSDFVIGDEVSDDDVIPKGTKSEVDLEGDDIHPAYYDSENESHSDDSESSEEDVVEAGNDDFDEHRLSDDDAENPRYLVFNPKTIYNPTFVLEMVFSSKAEFRKAVQSHAINTRRNLKAVKNDDIRVYVKCNGKNCDWRMHLLKMNNQSSWQIREYQDKYKCAATHNVKILKSSWLSERYIQRFQSDPQRKLKGFRLDVISDIRCNVSRQQSYRAKKKALELIQGNPDEQYAKLWSYVDELRKTNPGSTVLLGTDDDHRFCSFYICFDGLRRGFFGGCKPLFPQRMLWGVLFTAVGVDPNNNLYLIAYAVVSTESKNTWEWFLTVLKQDIDITKPEEYAFISDKQKGLIQAFGAIFSGSEHRFCVRHLHNNMKTAGFRGMGYKNMLWNAAKATTTGEFRARMREMKEYNQSAWEWFNDKPPTQWSKAFFREKPKCDMLLNNACEAFNSNILEARDKPIITMLEWIRGYLMTRLQKNRDRALAKWNDKLCPKINKILDRFTEDVGDYISIKSSNSHYQISCFDGTQYTVDLEKWTCSCRSWKLTGIPCKHAISVILNQNQLPEDYVDRYYYVETYIRVYEPAIMGISFEQLWGDTLFIPPLPPNFAKKKRGRPVKARRRESDEPAQGSKMRKGGNGDVSVRMRRQQRTVKCSKCNIPGHNAGGCPQVDRAQSTVENIQAKGKSKLGTTEDTIKTDSGKTSKESRKVAGNRKTSGRGTVKSAVDTVGCEPNNVNVVKPPLPVPNAQHDDVEFLQDDNVNLYEPPEGPFIPGPSMFEQLQLGKNDASGGLGASNSKAHPTDCQLSEGATNAQEEIPTQMSQITREDLHEPPQDPFIPRPSTLAAPQVQSAAPVTSLQPRVQIRAPPLFSGGYFTAKWIKTRVKETPNQFRNGKS